VLVNLDAALSLVPPERKKCGLSSLIRFGQAGDVQPCEHAIFLSADGQSECRGTKVWHADNLLLYYHPWVDAHEKQCGDCGLREFQFFCCDYYPGCRARYRPEQPFFAKYIYRTWKVGDGRWKLRIWIYIAFALNPVAYWQEVAAAQDRENPDAPPHKVTT